MKTAPAIKGGPADTLHCTLRDLKIPKLIRKTLVPLPHTVVRGLVIVSPTVNNKERLVVWG